MTDDILDGPGDAADEAALLLHDEARAAYDHALDAFGDVFAERVSTMTDDEREATVTLLGDDVALAWRDVLDAAEMLTAVHDE